MKNFDFQGHPPKVGLSVAKASAPINVLKL